MKSLYVILLSGLLYNTGFAADSLFSSNGSDKKPTNLSKGWSCTNNASNDTDDQKQRAKEMDSNRGSVHPAFAHAAKHCHNCTKIVCEQKD